MKEERARFRRHPSDNNNNCESCHTHTGPNRRQTTPPLKRTARPTHTHPGRHCPSGGDGSRRSHPAPEPPAACRSTWSSRAAMAVTAAMTGSRARAARARRARPSPPRAFARERSRAQRAAASNCRGRGARAHRTCGTWRARAPRRATTTHSLVNPVAARPVGRPIILRLIISSSRAAQPTTSALEATASRPQHRAAGSSVTLRAISHWPASAHALIAAPKHAASGAGAPPLPRTHASTRRSSVASTR